MVKRIENSTKNPIVGFVKTLMFSHVRRILKRLMAGCANI